MTTTAMAATVITTTATIGRDEARALTDRIKATADQLWALLLEAHDREAWRALGYLNFREYAKNEFGMGQSHAYRLLDQGRVIRALEDAAGSPVGEIVTERVARDIKPNLTLVTAEISERIQAGEAPEDAVETVISAARKPTYLTSRKWADRPNRFVEHLALAAHNDWIDFDLGLRDSLRFDSIDVTALDPSRIAEWAQTFRKAAAKMSLFATRLEKAARERA